MVHLPLTIGETPQVGLATVFCHWLQPAGVGYGGGPWRPCVACAASRSVRRYRLYCPTTGDPSGYRSSRRRGWGDGVALAIGRCRPGDPSGPDPQPAHLGAGAMGRCRPGPSGGATGLARGWGVHASSGELCASAFATNPAARQPGPPAAGRGETLQAAAGFPHRRTVGPAHEQCRLRCCGWFGVDWYLCRGSAVGCTGPTGCCALTAARQ